jgi:GTP cyclohydrolase IA
VAGVRATHGAMPPTQGKVVPVQIVYYCKQRKGESCVASATASHEPTRKRIMVNKLNAHKPSHGARLDGHLSHPYGSGSNGHHNGHNGHKEEQDLLRTIQAKFNSAEFLRTFELDLPTVDMEAIEDATRQILVAVGEDPEREGLLNTPRRVAKAYDELLSGYRTDPAELINNAIFDVEYDDMVIVRDIEYSSLCEHHMLPFIGRAHVAYIPNKKVIGLSKLPRIVDMFARRLQVQERMTRQVADFINEVLEPKGVAVVMDGTHMCSMMRGVKKCHSGMTTSAMLGVFREDDRTRAEFMSHINRVSGRSMF